MMMVVMHLQPSLLFLQLPHRPSALLLLLSLFLLYLTQSQRLPLSERQPHRL
jgi:hypothetical protein